MQKKRIEVIYSETDGFQTSFFNDLRRTSPAAIVQLQIITSIIKKEEEGNRITLQIITKIWAQDGSVVRILGSKTDAQWA